jgi:hypothetical protein
MFRHRTGYGRAGRELAATPFVSVAAEGHLRNESPYSKNSPRGARSQIL